MKTKPLLIIITCAVVIICVFLFVKVKYFTKPAQGEITQFLTDFNYELKGGHTDSILIYFEAGKNQKAFALLVNVLSGKTGLNGKSAPTFKVSLNTDDIRIISGDADITVAEVPVSFSSDSVATKTSSITFTILKIADHQFKIVGVKTNEFIKGYVAYANLIRGKTVPETTIYSAITLAAFKTAAALKTSYDSVLWFDHVNGKTYFYVIKGTLNDQFYWGDEQKPADYTPTYKMGLVNPDLKEIIPPEYDLIHNINGTIDGLIEVEKNGKRGFYNLDGKLVVPVKYEQIFPLNDDENLALLRNGADYFYFKKDSTITDKIADFKIADVLPKIKIYGSSYTVSGKSLENIMEYNARDNFNSLVVSPSYLVDLKIQDAFIDLPDTLRKSSDGLDYSEGIQSLKIQYDGTKQNDDSWLAMALYSLFNNYIDGRSGLYVTEKTKNVIIIDKKQNRLLGFNTMLYQGGDEEEEDGEPIINDLCNESSVRAINDSLFEFKLSTQFDQPMLKDSINAGPSYYYLAVKNGKLAGLPNHRLFGCTKYVKLDDSYLRGCYVVNGKVLDHLTPGMLEYMKNEIYGSYHYAFKDDAWNQVFQDRFYFGNEKSNASVDDSLTDIDKYNINWISKKIKEESDSKLVAQK